MPWKKPAFRIGLALIVAGLGLYAYRLFQAGGATVCAPLQAREFAPVL